MGSGRWGSAFVLWLMPRHDPGVAVGPPGTGLTLIPLFAPLEDGAHHQGMSEDKGEEPLLRPCGEISSRARVIGRPAGSSPLPFPT